MSSRAKRKREQNQERRDPPLSGQARREERVAWTRAIASTMTDADLGRNVSITMPLIGWVMFHTTLEAVAASLGVSLGVPASEEPRRIAAEISRVCDLEHKPPIEPEEAFTVTLSFNDWMILYLTVDHAGDSPNAAKMDTAAAYERLLGFVRTALEMEFAHIHP